MIPPTICAQLARQRQQELIGRASGPTTRERRDRRVRSGSRLRLRRRRAVSTAGSPA